MRDVAVLIALLGGSALTAAQLHAQSWRTLTASRQLASERSLDVEVRYAAGTFSVRPAEPDILYRMDLRYDEDQFRPVNEFRGGRLELGVDGRHDDLTVGDGDAGHLDLSLARDVPMDLELEFGAVRATLDLGGLALTDLAMRTGASETRLEVSRPNPVSLGTARMDVGAAQFHATGLGNLNAGRFQLDAGVGDIRLDFTGVWQRDAAVEVDMGLGSLELVFPEGLGVKLERDSFLTKLEAPRLIQRGEAYYSENWDTAERRVEVDVDAAFGKISIEWAR